MAVSATASSAVLKWAGKRGAVKNRRTISYCWLESRSSQRIILVNLVKAADRGRPSRLNKDELLLSYKGKIGRAVRTSLHLLESHLEEDGRTHDV